MVAVQVEVGQIKAEYAEIQKVLRTNNPEGRLFGLRCHLVIVGIMFHYPFAMVLHGDVFRDAETFLVG